MTTELTWTDFDDKDHLGGGHEILPEEERVAKLILFYQQVGDGGTMFNPVYRSVAYAHIVEGNPNIEELIY